MSESWQAFDMSRLVNSIKTSSLLALVNKKIFAFGTLSIRAARLAFIFKEN